MKRRSRRCLNGLLNYKGKRMTITIDKIELNKSMQIFRKNLDLSKTKINDEFIKLATQKRKQGNYLIKEIKKPKTIDSHDIHYSIMSFKFLEEPTFLTETTISEDKYALLLLIEYSDFIFVFKKHINSIEKSFDGFIESFEYDKFSHFKASRKPKYEKVSMGNMSISDAVIRSRSYEAHNLHGTLPLLSASRSVARNLRINDSGTTYSITPSTSRINETSTKVDLDEYIKWCLSIAHEITTNTTKSDFIENFASPITLEDILISHHHPIGILFHFEILEELINEGMLVVTEYDASTNSYTILSSNRVTSLLQIFRKVFNVRQEGDIYKVYYKTISLASFKANKKTFSFKDTVLETIYFEFSEERLSVKDYLNQEKLYSVVFNNPKYAFIDNYAFEDRKLLTQTNIKKILSICDTNHNMTGIKSEKEKPHNPSLSRFPSESLFYQIEETFNDSILICDDMNDEWADHICIRDNEICFIHSKFTTNDSYGASAMHDVISQALKNIGRVHTPIAEYQRKFIDKWTHKYESTQINRLRKANSAIQPTLIEIETALENVYSNPNAHRKVYLATPFFSKTKLDSELHKFITNTQTNVHYYQLIWLLSAFISSCQEYGVQPYILCKQ